jgi:hypothetical protein
MTILLPKIINNIKLLDKNQPTNPNFFPLYTGVLQDAIPGKAGIYNFIKSIPGFPLARE